jgi:succinoglycan biosynthesis protein ExoM
MLISICISTYRRPQGLQRLLESLNQLRFDRLETPEIEVIVIENDVSGKSVEICDAIRPIFKWQLKFAIEPKQGISYARNRSVAAASPASDFIAIIDDDETAAPDWLEQLLIAQQQYCADVVSGPSIPYFVDPDVPKWIAKGNFFDPPSYTSGESIDVAFTNNVLIRSKIVRNIDVVFDERFALTGGEDSHLFMRLYRTGYRIVWSNEAIVTEWVPKSRTNLRYILRRGYSSWSIYSLLERELYPSLKVQGMRIVKGLGLIVSGALLSIPAIWKGQQALATALRSIYRGCGTMAGLLGFNYAAYK